MPDTEFFLPVTSHNEKINAITKYKFGGEQKCIALLYTDFIPEEGMIKCSYEYYLDESDVDYLLTLLANKYGVKDKKDLISIYRLFSGDSPDYDYYDESIVLNACWYDLQKYEPELFTRMHDYCLSKAKNEFLLAFDYWVDDDQRIDYYECDEI